MGKWSDDFGRELNHDDAEFEVNNGRLMSDGNGGYYDGNGSHYNSNYESDDQDDT